MSDSPNDATTSKNLILLIGGLILTTIGVAAIASMIAY